MHIYTRLLLLLFHFDDCQGSDVWAYISIGDTQRKWCVLSFLFFCVSVLVRFFSALFSIRATYESSVHCMEWSRKVTLASHWLSWRCEKRGAAIHTYNTYKATHTAYTYIFVRILDLHLVATLQCNCLFKCAHRHHGCTTLTFPILTSCL